MNRRSNAWGRLSYTGHVALFSSCSPLIFFHADKTTELAAAIIPVMILHGLHTDSTYHSPLRETFVKDIREDFSNLVHCNLAWIYPIVWYQTKTKCRFPDFQDNVNLITWLLGFGNVCIDGIGRKKTTEICVKQPLVTSHRFSRKWNQKLQENTSLILLVTGIRWQIIMYKS